MILIGLSGAAGAGKSTVAQYAERHNFQRLSFATPIKLMLSAGGFGLTWEHLFGDAKNDPLECFGGASTRKAMQTLGTEWGRALWPNIWVHATEQHIKTYPKSAKLVIEDTRFANEVEMIHRLGGKVWLVRREVAEAISHAHASEAYWRLMDPDHTLDNNDSLDNLFNRVDWLLS